MGVQSPAAAGTAGGNGDVDGAVDRGWHMDGPLLIPNPEKFLTTRPYLPTQPGQLELLVVVPRIPRDD